MKKRKLRRKIKRLQHAIENLQLRVTSLEENPWFYLQQRVRDETISCYPGDSTTSPKPQPPILPNGRIGGSRKNTCEAV